MVGCASGLMATGGAKGVGATTRSAVRTSIIMIIIPNRIKPLPGTIFIGASEAFFSNA